MLITFQLYVLFISFFTLLNRKLSLGKETGFADSVLPCPWVRVPFHSILSFRDRTLRTCDQAPIWLRIGNRLGRRSIWANRCRSLRISRYQSNSCLLLPWRRVFPVEDWIPLIDRRIVLIVTRVRQKQTLKSSYFHVRWLYQRKRVEKKPSFNANI